MPQKRNRLSQLNSHTLSVTLSLPKSKLTLTVPNPCPIAQLMLELTHSLEGTTIVYVRTADQDTLTDYKLQSRQGVLRKDLNLVAVEGIRKPLTGADRYQMCKCVGVGGFSKVYLVRDRIDGAFYAAKYIEKATLSDKRDLILNERDLNRIIDSPFLVRMHHFFETDEHYLMIMDYCPGGELFNLQRKLRRFQQEEAKHYFIQVMLALESLHSQGIVYRDLKPQNIMIAADGHLKLADFGLAKPVGREKLYSYCGSLEYMCPQIVMRTGHSFEVDYYSLGALLFEMVVGCPPFYNPTATQMELKEKIVVKEVMFPDDVPLTPQIKDFICKLLEKEPQKRLGHFGGIKQLQCHPWLGFINKKHYLNKQIRMKHQVDFDRFNFDSKDIPLSANRLLLQLKPRGSSKASNSNQRKSSKTKSVGIRYGSLGRKKSQQDPYILTLSKVRKNGSQPNLGVPKINPMASIRKCYSPNKTMSLGKFKRFNTESSATEGIMVTQLVVPKKSYLQAKVNTEARQTKPMLKKRRTRGEFMFDKVRIR